MNDTPLKADCPSAPCSTSYNLLENQKSMTESEIWNANANKAADEYANAMGYVKCCKERTLVFASFKSGLAYDRDLYKDQNLSQITLSTCDKLFPENSQAQARPALPERNVRNNQPIPNPERTMNNTPTPRTNDC